MFSPTHKKTKKSWEFQKGRKRDASLNTYLLACQPELRKPERREGKRGALPPKTIPPSCMGQAGERQSEKNGNNMTPDRCIFWWNIHPNTPIKHPDKKGTLGQSHCRSPYAKLSNFQLLTLAKTPSASASLLFSPLFLPPRDSFRGEKEGGTLMHI